MALSLSKAELLQRIIDRLAHDLDVFFTAAKTSHEAATDKENLPDNKYCTLALEASYVAQGQANRAQELRQSLDAYKRLILAPENGVICLTSLVTVEAGDGAHKTVFIGPLEGGLRIADGLDEIMVITPASPLGRELIGKQCGDTIVVATGAGRLEYEIVSVA